jgi:transposase-like protein
MMRDCPYCKPNADGFVFRPQVKRSGHFRRKSDCRIIQKYRCLRCLKYFSNATGHPCFNQKKRHLNDRFKKNLCSGISMRRLSKLFRVSRTTVARKLAFLGQQAKLELEQLNHARKVSEIVEFDDMETFEHTKCKPLSLTLAVEHNTRWILGIEVAQMAAKGKLTRLAFKKYGLRKDERALGRAKLFSRIQSFVSPSALIKSDENPHYISDVKRFFPEAKHERHKGQRGSIVGQGELKKIRFDPLFSLNHTCAMYRANVNRLFRKTWCTTKNRERLEFHLNMYAVFHNKLLLNAS